MLRHTDPRSLIFFCFCPGELNSRYYVQQEWRWIKNGMPHSSIILLFPHHRSQTLFATILRDIYLASSGYRSDTRLHQSLELCAFVVKSINKRTNNMAAENEGSIPLKATAAYSVLTQKKEILKELIRKNSHSLRDVSFSGSFLGGSIGDIISDKLGGSSSRGGGLCDFAYWQDDDDESIEEDLPFSMQGAPDLVGDSDCSESSSPCPIELTPGVEKTLRSSNETWHAIRNGKMIKTSCPACSIELHCIHDAEYVVCPECWSASPIEHEIGGIALEFDDPDMSSSGDGISLGIREEHVLHWLDNNEE